MSCMDFRANLHAIVASMSRNLSRNASYDIGNDIIHNTEVLKSTVCDHKDANVFIRGDMTINGYSQAI